MQLLKVTKLYKKYNSKSDFAISDISLKGKSGEIIGLLGHNGAGKSTLMKMIVEGVMESNLPWELVFIGVFLAIVVEILGIPVLPFAIGVYLPVQLSTCIMAGGLVRLGFDKMKRKDEEKKQIVSDGILYCSGMIAGEGLVGIILAILAIFGIEQAIDVSKYMNVAESISAIGSVGVFALIILSLLKFSVWKKRK